MQFDPLEQLDVFSGEANNAEARVYARLAGEGLPPGAQLSGRVIGPSCAYAQTLSAAIRLTPKQTPSNALEPAPLLAEAIVPDPCFWSAEMPFLYRVEVEVRSGDHAPAAAERTLGIRPLGARGKKLILEGRPWVVRAIHNLQLPASNLSAWHAADAVMAVEDPDDELCREASRLGVWLAAWISPRADRVEAELRRLSRWPCVALAVLDSEAELSAAARTAARNLLLAQHVGPGARLAPADWADAAICEDDDVERLAARAAPCIKPVLALRRGSWHDDLAAARRACDQLQRDLAGRGDFAGYVTRLSS